MREHDAIMAVQQFGVCINYIIDNCKYISEKDLDFIIRIITLMRDEYLKKINNQNDK